jgi:MYXO-CTERM domain-containing protein
MQYRNTAAGMAVGALLAVLAAAPKPAQAAFTVTQNFTGASINEAEGRAIPPDTMGAVGPNDFVELLNGRYAVYDRTGTLVQGLTQDDFWRAGGLSLVAGQGSSDPRITFDKNSGHWFATALANLGSTDSRYLVGVSNTSDPTQGWHAFEFKADPNNLRWADFDTLGFNKDGVYVGANIFPVDPNSMLPTQAALLAINKANLIAGAPTGTLFDNVDVFGAGFTPQPVNNLDNGPTPELVYADFNGPAGVLKSAQIVGPNEGNALSVGADLPNAGFVNVAPYDAPPTAHQPGGDNSIDSGDARLNTSLIEQNGKIWGVHTVLNGTHAGLRWFRLNPLTGVEEDQGTIGDSTNDYYDGSIAVNPDGFVVIGYTRSSDTEFASAYASTGFFDGTTTTFDAPLLLKGGANTYDLKYTGTVNRWGDYSATTIDPNNPKEFWTVQEWASGTNIWSTQIAELHDPTPDPPATPEPASLAMLAAGVLPLLRRRRAATV